jgi:hypothetical protein
MAKKNSDSEPDIHVESHNQQGGITAYKVNVGAQPRTLQGIDLRGGVEWLSEYAGTEIVVACLALDVEASRFADDIAALLKAANWNVGPVNRTLLGHEFRGVVVRTSASEIPNALRSLARGLTGLGFYVEAGAASPIANGNEVLVLGNER